MSNNIVLELERNNYSRNLNKMVKFRDKIQANDKIFLKGLSKDRVSYD